MLSMWRHVIPSGADSLHFAILQYFSKHCCFSIFLLDEAISATNLTGILRTLAKMARVRIRWDFYPALA
ncbi:hypothetical protein CDEST_02026 [Colletotrichum destructivum]|uniref:Uncharacterized protein n=1 Tax=Colletotrichum destructivum TaxID=34406 RepID=A0AAX4I1M1_9PEZI|nr:hypothetical protein CDEST_02026 [Colletotrichum destructivum]